MSLEDAHRITTSDVRFPSNPRSAEKKLYGFSIIVDLFHGVAHPVAVSICNMVIRLGPAFHRLADQYADTPTQGMDLVCRVLYDIQQDYFRYVADVSNGVAGIVTTFGAPLLGSNEPRLPADLERSSQPTTHTSTASTTDMSSHVKPKPPPTTDTQDVRQIPSPSRKKA